MSTFRVRFEASAAVGIEIEIEAKDASQAEDRAMRMMDARELPFSDAVDYLMRPTPHAIKTYALTFKTPITHVSIEEDENGFEVVDVEEKDRSLSDIDRDLEQFP